MVDKAKLQEVQKRFENDGFATENGARIEEIDDGYAKVVMDLDPHHYNAVGGVMGGAIFTAADFAFAAASNWQERTAVSQTAQITYLGRVKGRQLIAEARCVKDGRSICYYVIDVTDELGSRVAQVTSSGFYMN